MWLKDNVGRPSAWNRTYQRCSGKSTLRGVTNSFPLLVIPDLDKPALYLVLGNSVFLSWIPAFVGMAPSELIQRTNLIPLHSPLSKWGRTSPSLNYLFPAESKYQGTEE
jgi:hypothetical protein